MYYNTTVAKTKRRVFISHYKGDRTEVDKFIDDFANQAGVFTPYVLGANDNDDFIDSTDTDYVMTQIRQKYMLTNFHKQTIHFRFPQSALRGHRENSVLLCVLCVSMVKSDGL